MKENPIKIKIKNTRTNEKFPICKGKAGLALTHKKNNKKNAVNMGIVGDWDHVSLMQALDHLEFQIIHAFTNLDEEKTIYNLLKNPETSGKVLDQLREDMGETDYQRFKRYTYYIQKLKLDESVGIKWD